MSEFEKMNLSLNRLRKNRRIKLSDRRKKYLKKINLMLYRANWEAQEHLVLLERILNGIKKAS